MSTARPCRAKNPLTCAYHGKALRAAQQFAAEYKSQPQIDPEHVSWLERHATLFKTPHGSHLYGLAHAGSDEDYFIVYPISNFESRQSIVNGIDANRMSFNYFLEKANYGSHQALEAMFSRQATIDQFAAFRAGYHAQGSVVTQTYLRTIRNFAFGDNYKRRRHALRLAANLHDLLRYGRFNPTLSDQVIKRITEATNEGVVPDLKYLDAVRASVPFELTWSFEYEGETINERIAALAAKRTR